MKSPIEHVSAGALWGKNHTQTESIDRGHIESSGVDSMMAAVVLILEQRATKTTPPNACIPVRFSGTLRKGHQHVVHGVRSGRDAKSAQGEDRREDQAGR